MAGTAHTHVQMAARVMWKPNFAGKGAFKPFQSRPLLRSAACRTKAASGDLQLVKREETNDGAILFVFGDEAAVEAQKKEEESAAPPAPAAEEEETPPMQEEPVQEPAPEPDVSYEAARAEQVAESAAEAGPAAEEEEQHHAQPEDEGPVNGALVPDFADPEMDPDELLSDEDAPDLQDEIAKTLTSLRVADLKAMCKERGISGYSKYRKSQLVRVLKEAMLVESE